MSAWTNSGSFAVSPGSNRRLSSRVTSGSHRRASPHRRNAIGRVRLALRAAEVGAGSDARPRLKQVAQRRDRRSNPEIVSDVPIADGHVEIGPDQDGLAAEIAQIFQAMNVDHSLLASSLRGPLGGLLHRSLLLPNRHSQIDETVAVPGLVVVPTKHLEEVAAALGERSVEHTRGAVRRCPMTRWALRCSRELCEAGRTWRLP